MFDPNKLNDEAHHAYHHSLEYALERFIDTLRAQTDDNDDQIIEKWKKVVDLDIMAVISAMRQEEEEEFDRWVHGNGHCTSCGKEIPRLEMYSYESRELKKLQYYHERGRMGPSIGACYDCQKAFLDQHTFICSDCGSSYFRGNYLQTRCPSCQEKESRIVPHKTRARKLGLAATLTHKQWAETLDHFNNCCAYCGEAYEVIEHFTPLSSGGETSARNCVPACLRCNSTKHDIDGRTEQEQLASRLGVSTEKLESIANYLNTR